MTEVLIAIPAHDEAAEIGSCLEHVAAAARWARCRPPYPRLTVAVAAHRCADDTFEVATAALAGVPGRHLVTRDDTSDTVGQVRSRLVALLASRARSAPERTWVLSTDADSLVPPDWVSGTLDLARRRAAVAVAGMVELREWDAPAEVRRRYDEVVASGTGPDGHTHVYGANLAVRLDAYRRAGGFRPGHGEDQDLVDRLRGSGEAVVSAFTPVVRTSARHPGRAEHGLGALLQQLQEPHVARVGG